MIEETIEVRAIRLAIGPSRRKRRPDDCVEFPVFEPPRNDPADRRIRIPLVEAAIMPDHSPDPSRPRFGRNLLSNTELRYGLVEALDRERNPSSLDFSRRRIDDQSDSAIQSNPGKLDWKLRPISAKGTCPGQRSRIPYERSPGQASDSEDRQWTGLTGRSVVGFRRRFISVGRRKIMADEFIDLGPFRVVEIVLVASDLGAADFVGIRIALLAGLHATPRQPENVLLLEFSHVLDTRILDGAID
jgi:hypothetical protein